MKEIDAAQRMKEIDADVERDRIHNKTAVKKMYAIKQIIDSITKSDEHSFIPLYIFILISCIVMGIASLPSMISNYKTEKAEDARVQEIYDEVLDLVDSEKYEKALRLANSIDYSASIDEKKSDEWDDRRRRLIALIRDEMGIEHVMISIPEKSSYYELKNYKDVKTIFENLGFLDITTEGQSVDGFILNRIYEEDDVIEVSINGITKWDKETEFSDDAIVVIRYKK